MRKWPFAEFAQGKRVASGEWREREREEREEREEGFLTLLKMTGSFVGEKQGLTQRARRERRGHGEWGEFGISYCLHKEEIWLGRHRRLKISR